MSICPEEISKLPDLPGIYLMKDATKKVLYIGKAKKLKTRVRQYFPNLSGKRQDLREMIPYLTSQVETIDFIITNTEKEALLLENQLIKEHLPKYNVLLKDDKSFISLVLTDHEWPMLKLMRFKEKPSEKMKRIFGPYTSAHAARETFDLILKLFPLRQCSDLEFSSRKRACLLYEIKRCKAPCIKKCSHEEYDLLVDHVESFLKGNAKQVIDQLKEEMEKASSNLEFEKAGQIFKMIGQIEHVMEKQHVSYTHVHDCDVIALYREYDSVVISMLNFRNNNLTSSNHFNFHLIASSDEEIMESFLLQHYSNHTKAPSELLISTDLSSQKELEEILDTKILHPQKGEKRAIIEMGLKNAKALFVSDQSDSSLKEKILIHLNETLQLTRFPKVIECIDTSNLSGKDATAAIVSFVDGKKEPSRRRLFKIRGQTDDYHAMKEVLTRHLKKQKETNQFPDLLILDGGKGQLSIAKEVFLELEIASIDLIAFTKEEARHDKGLSQEKIYFADQKEPLWIERKSPILFLLQQIRDEAHRQAILLHRKQRSKRLIHSELDEIQGIGPVKRKIVLSHFKSVEKLKQADEKALQEVKGLTAKDRKILLKYIQGFIVD